jgi:CheY-like chemotaxis protein
VVVGDRMRLQQVLLNLAGNAIKFTELGDVEISLQVRELPSTFGKGAGGEGQTENAPAMAASPHSNPLRTPTESCSGEKTVSLQFAVRDTGIGIPPAGLERLFQPFSQVVPSMTRRFGGTGLGLSISKNLVEMMGGRIWAESELGKGSTFYITVCLPLSKELPADFEAPVAIPTTACAQLHILLVEDNLANQKLATYILQDRGHLVEIAGDGQEAIYLTQANCYDVILMDVQMPGMNGLEATAAIRKREAEKGTQLVCARHPPDRSGKLAASPFPCRVPIIAMTAHAMREDRQRCLAAGMDGYLSKPVNAQEMIGLVESLALSTVPGEQLAQTNPSLAETSNTPQSVIFNYDDALARCFNSQNLLKEMIQCFFDEVDKLFPLMRAALEKGDLVEVGHLGHRVKGTVVYLGAQPAKEAALRVERFCKSSGGTPSEAQEAINALEHQCSVLKAELAGHPLAAEMK